MSDKEYRVQLTRWHKCDAEEEVISAKSEEEAMKIYLEMVSCGLVSIEEVSTEDDWYCEEVE